MTPDLISAEMAAMTWDAVTAFLQGPCPCGKAMDAGAGRIKRTQALIQEFRATDPGWAQELREILQDEKAGMKILQAGHRTICLGNPA